MKPNVYIETTIPSFYYEVRTEPDMVARRAWTRQWWDGHLADYDACTSEAGQDFACVDVTPCGQASEAQLAQAAFRARHSGVVQRPAGSRALARPSLHALRTAMVVSS